MFCSEKKSDLQHNVQIMNICKKKFMRSIGMKSLTMKSLNEYFADEKRLIYVNLFQQP